MDLYRTKAAKLSGSNFHEVNKLAYAEFVILKRKTKRRTYIRSKYFKKQKIFLDLFWDHLHEKKNYRDKVRRVKYFTCGIELLKNSTVEPKIVQNPNKKSEILYRFSGVDPSGEKFIVQVKENGNSGEKYLISIFPIE